MVRRQLKRRSVLAFFQKLPPSLVGIEACASSHHWSRELRALGHTVRLIQPACVKSYAKRQKNDAGTHRSFLRNASICSGSLSSSVVKLFFESPCARSSSSSLA